MILTSPAQSDTGPAVFRALHDDSSYPFHLLAHARTRHHLRVCGVCPKNPRGLATGWSCADDELRDRI